MLDNIALRRIKMSDESKCPVCHGNASVERLASIDCSRVECESCGRFIISTFVKPVKNMNKLASYLYYNGKINQPIKAEDGQFFNFVGSEGLYNNTFKENHNCFFVSNDVIENWYPSSFADKVDIFLLGIWKLQKYLGYGVSLTVEEWYSATFVNRWDETVKLRDSFDCDIQANYLMEYLSSQNFIVNNDYNHITLKTPALKRIDELQKNITKESKTAFIAMSFKPEMHEIRDVIKAAVEKAGFIPKIMDEVEHNHQIVPEMLYQIRQAKFVIAELTNHNNGAYFEAGYALGIGKEVIQLCKEDSFNTDCHFDVKQINTIRWTDLTHLKEALYNRIISTI